MSAARDALWEAGIDETVEVNQRALIDKILARYSGEHTVFRELLQNADDARSKSIEIKFTTRGAVESKAPTAAGVTSTQLPDLEHADIVKWTFRNDGDRFRGEDWNRLKKIAEGNPDESKIGAFGVGFYALFSVTESPFVTSGDEWMGFYWKDGKDQLYVRRGKLPPSESSSSDDAARWTSFEMDLRDPAPMLTKPLDLAKFIATSITFMTHIRQISVFVDEHKLFAISKVAGLTEPVRWPAKLKTASPLGYMKMATVTSQAVVITANVTRWVYAFGSDSTVAQEKQIAKAKPAQGFFASLNAFSSFLGGSGSSTPVQEVDTRTPLQRLTDAEKLEVIERGVQLQIFSADINVKLPNKVASEIERATRKKSPAKLAYQIVFTDKDGYDASVKEDSAVNYADISVFQGVRADIDGTGSAKLFIGHATAQSTGVGGHHASRFIPTVEREALDLVDATVAIFNKELLAMGGVLSRVIYETEMDIISQLWSKAKSVQTDDASSVTALEERFTHLLQFFAFRGSTPSPVVSYTMKMAFLGASTTQGITLLSTAGVRPSTDVRRYDEELYGFLKTVPFLKPKVSSTAESLLSSSNAIAPIRSVDMKDILAELQSRALDEDEMIKCLKWRLSINESIIRQNPKAMTADFLAAATVFIPAGKTKTERVIALDQIKTYFVASNGVIKDSPLPPHTLPATLGDALPLPKLAAAFSWRPLAPAAWLKWLAVDGVDTISDAFRIQSSAEFSQRVLETVSEEVWDTKMSLDEKNATKAVLAAVTCVPTNLGMKNPSSAYFSNVNVFPDLPIVSLPKAEKKGSLQIMLKFLGVRDHVDLQLIFTRHIASGKWSIPDLIGYFVSIKDILTREEVDKLRKTSMFFAAPGTAIPTDGTTTTRRYLASQLHEPTPENIALGLPVLDWTGSTWDSKSAQAQFTFSLGLQKHPSVEALIRIAASDDVTKRKAALRYLLSHFDQHYRSSYSPSAYGRIPFVPVVLPDGSQKLLPPTQVFSQPDCAILGFPVVTEDIRADTQKLQILEHPKADQLVQKLFQSPPPTPELQRKTFEYLAGQIANFQPSDFQSLQLAKFILIERDGKQVFANPSECYIGKGDNSMHSKLFTFVDAGSPRAQAFLVACGVRPEPSPQEVVEILLRNPQSFFTLAGSESAYLEELRQIATSVKQGRIDRRTQQIMRNAPIFLASKLITSPSGANGKVDDDHDDDEMRTPHENRLLKPSEIIIVDDLVRYRLFKESVWAAPQEDFLEEFYLACGSQPISALVDEGLKASGDGNPRIAADIRQLIIERLPLFLHDRVGKPTAFKFTWFRAPENFIVKAVKVLNIENTLKLGRQRISKANTATAGATRHDKGPVVLYIASGGKDGRPDFIEVANSICQVMFKQHTGNDSLLLSTILSTELRALKRIGYDVDRIIGQQKEAAEQRKRQEGIMKFPQAEAPTQAPPIATNASSPSSLPARPHLPLPAPVQQVANNVLSGGLKSSLDSWKSKLLQQKTTNAGRPQLAEGPSAAPNAGSVRSSPNPSRGMTPTADIERNMQVALAGCRKDTSSRIDSRSQMSIVKETQNSGYCDESANADLQFIRQIAGHRFYLANGIESPDSVVEKKLGAIERFANVLAPLRDQVFNIGDSVSIFYDLSGPLIAFNRNGSIFMNLRPFEEWHDKQVAAGSYSDAMIFYYFVFGHEIAHNLVDVHNAEHEFYFSTICEKHLKQLSLFLVDQ